MAILVTCFNVFCVLVKNLCRGKDSMALSITKKQYAHLIREISDALKDNIRGGGMYDFAAPEIYSEHPMSQVKFWVADGTMQGGGFFSSIGKAFKSVYKALKNTGVVDKAKQAALSKGRELGGQASCWPIHVRVSWRVRAFF
jgi:hypothetical protein